MTLVKFKNRPADKLFNNFMDDFFTPFPSMLKDNLVAANFKQFAPMNVIEKEGGYEVEVVAPGMEKEDFKISMDKNLLTITGEKKETAENNNKKYTRREYKYQSFTRSFTIDETIDTEKIDAKYVNGVLTLNLPKKPEVKASAKEINVQ
ncbi:MAG: Hsp20/alpha crystallin family protein [Flavisolibacter sp.]|nr:Hsp20/alpha crystallin family protein [Flavisolibacter sp.]